jgi:hypothetical protein
MKASKTPTISKDTKILSFDIESNGLHGQAFAVAGVVIDAAGQTLDSFIARIKIEDSVDDWVKDNVLPVIADIGISHGSYTAMCDAFWRWFVAAQEKSDYVVISNGYPVEYRFMADCQDNDLDRRYWEHPFPILELPSLLIGNERVSEASRLKVIDTATSGRKLVRHHPMDDAIATALTAHAVLNTRRA